MKGPVAWLLEYAAKTPDAPAVGTPDGWASYGQLQERVRILRALLLRSGVKPGARVILALPNTVGAVACWLAVQSLGATTVELDREWSEQALCEVTAQTRATVAVIGSRDARKWAEAVGVEQVFTMHSGKPPDTVAQALRGRFSGWFTEAGESDVALDAQMPWSEPELAQIVFTSGSTATPRGVMQTTANLAASTNAIVEYLSLQPSDRAMLILPLFYVYGKSVLMSHLRVGASVFFDYRFMYPKLVMETMAQERCTNFSGVPLTYESLKRQVDFSAMRFEHLRFLTQAGGAMASDTIAWVRHTFAAPLFVMYGQTEATSRLSYLPPEFAASKAGSIGRGMPHVELRVVDEAGRDVAVGEEGQLIARGPVVMPGYLDAPAETAAVLKDGWLWTGDLAKRDADGFIFIVGRAKQVLKLGGHRVSPAELEQALRAHSGVRDAVVVGAPHALEGEVAVAFVVRDDGALEEAALLKHCRGLLPAARVPRRVVFVNEFPRNSAGKVLVGELKKQAATLGGDKAHGEVS